MSDFAGSIVELIGSVHSGNMTDNKNEGHPGWIIQDIATQAPQDFSQHPNVILVMAGTNDIVQNKDLPNAPARLGALIDGLFNGSPDSVVLVAQLIPFADPTREANRVTFNAALPNVIAARTNAGKHVLLVDMSQILPSDLVADGIHPNDGGYAKMARAWVVGINQANSNGWISAPLASSKLACGSWSGSTKIITGAGTAPAGAGVRIADVTGDGLNDYVWIDTNGAAYLYKNLGPAAFPTWGSEGLIATGVGAAQENVFLADINCDGLADYVVILPSGDIEVYYNLGESEFPNWQGPAVTHIINGSYPQASIRLADINGDRCADLLTVDPNGYTIAYLNEGGSSPSFQSPIVLATGVGATRSEIQFADLTADGFADYLVVDTNSGAVHAWTNGGPNPNPSEPWLWYDSSVVATGTGSPGTSVTIADVTGDKAADYLVIDPTSGSINAWVNQC